VRLQVVADHAASKHTATPVITAKEGSRCAGSQRRTVEDVEMRTFGDEHVSREGRADTRIRVGAGIAAGGRRGCVCPISAAWASGLGLLT
jgi:hypothetical protein